MPRKKKPAETNEPEAMRVEVVPIDSIELDPNNARKHSRRNIAEIRASLKKYGQREAIVVNRRTGFVEAGNGRLTAARQLGWSSIAVHFVDDDDATAAGYGLAANRTAELASWHGDRLAATLGELTEAKVEVPGWSARELDKIIGKAPMKTSAADYESREAHELDELSTTIGTAPGQLWRLGRHRLVIGDMTDEAVRRRLVGDDLAAAVVTDPPYAIYGSSTGIASSIADDRPFFERVARACRQHTIEFGHVYIFGDWRSWAAWWDSCRRVELVVKNCVVWDKGGGLGSNYGNAHEFVLFAHSLPPEKAALNNARRTGIRRVLCPNVLRITRVGVGERRHNAAKPIELLDRLVCNSTDEGDLVIDWFGGSGSTLIACERAGRRAALTEIEPKWAAVIIDRWQIETGERAQLDEA